MQLWVNLVADKKSMAPEYEGIGGADMPMRDAGGQRIRTVAGKDSPVRLHTEVDILDVELLADSSFSREIVAGHSGLVYVLDGAIDLQGERLERRGAAILGPGAVELSGTAGARVMWLAGRAHGQPIHHRGPFVD